MGIYHGKLEVVQKTVNLIAIKIPSYKFGAPRNGAFCHEHSQLHSSGGARVGLDRIHQGSERDERHGLAHHFAKEVCVGHLGQITAF